MKKLVVLFLCGVFAWSGLTAVPACAGAPFKGAGVFNEKGFGYVMEYPVGWIYYTQEHHTAIFIGKAGGEPNLPTVMVKSLLSAKAGGAFRDVDGVIGDLENQLRSASEATIFNPKPFTYRKNNLDLAGKECVAEYAIKKEKYKQWVVVVPRKEGEAFYVWSYTAPARAYDEYLPTAVAMFDSWVITD